VTIPSAACDARRAGRRASRALLFLVVALAGLAGGPRAAEAGEVTDMLGRRVRVPDHAVRIVSLAPSITETVFVLGDGDRLVGVTDFCDYPPEAARKPRVGGISTPSFEAILALRPDLILATSESNYSEHVERLVSLGLAVYVVRPVDFETVLESIDRIGGVLGRDAAARAQVASMRRDADAIARAVAGSPRPRVLYVVWPNPLIAPGRGTLISELIQRAGGESVTGADPLPYPRLSLETVVERRPDRIIVGRHGQGTVEELLRGWERLGSVSAVREGRVYGVDGDLVHRPGPRMVEALRALARVIHPERVP
jgi:ABC-type Fe3+-hydroxamate transport system substrate-binding protein